MDGQVVTQVTSAHLEVVIFLVGILLGWVLSAKR